MKPQSFLKRFFGRAASFALVFLTLVAGCGQSNPFASSRGSKDVDERRLIAPADLWIVPKTSSFALSGRLEGDDYQLIGLENKSNMEGDNFLLLVAKGSRIQKREVFDPASVLGKLNINTAPFYGLKDSELRQRRVGGGKLFWKETGASGKVKCVLGLRRITEEQMSLPRNVFALEMILRNCVIGSFEDALEPILDRGVFYSTNDSPKPLWISPLAGPKR